MPFADGHLPGNGGSSLHTSVEDLLAARAFDDGIVDNGAALLQRYDPGDGPALVVVPHSTQTTEILLKVRRVNLLPISYPEEDSLFISRVWPRTAAAIDTVPDGTILLTSTLLPQTESYPPLPPILPRVLEKLHQRSTSRSWRAPRTACRSSASPHARSEQAEVEPSASRIIPVQSALLRSDTERHGRKRSAVAKVVQQRSRRENNCLCRGAVQAQRDLNRRGDCFGARLS